MRKKVIIDTDPGMDDAMALMLACASPELEILAVTTVCGNSTVENTTRNARFILDTMGRSDVPVYSGARKPLARQLIQAEVHGKSGLEGVTPSGSGRLTSDAPEQIVRLVQAYPDEVTLVTLGPLTNAAAAIRKYPRAMMRVKEIVSMGGAIRVPGNKNRVAEFNMFVDPEAADVVMRLPVPKILVPLDVCNLARMRLPDVRRIQNKPVRDMLASMFRSYIARLKKDVGSDAAILYDPLAIFYSLHPEACQVAQKHILVETKGKVTRGMTVADFRQVTDGAAPNTAVVTGVEVENFVRAFVDRLSSYQQG